MDKPPRRTIKKPELGRFALSDILEAGARLVARHFLVFLRITAALIVPVNAVFIALVLALGVHSTSKRTGYVVVAVFFAIELSALIVAGGACLKAAADAHLGEKVGTRASLSYLLGRLNQFMWLMALLLVGVGPGVVLYVIARTRSVGNLAALVLILIPLSLWLAGIWSVAAPALLIEGRSPLGALKRSRDLVRGGFGRSLGTVVFGSILALFAAFLVVLITSVFMTGGEKARFVVYISGLTVGEFFALPLLAAYLTVLYFDLRARKEKIRPKKAE